MVRKRNTLNKNLYRILIIGTFIAINALIVFGISEVLSYFKTGADRTTMLHLEVKNEDVYLPKITWGNLENPGRPIEEQTLQEIQEDYLDSWYVRNVAYKTNNPFGIKDFYTDSARVNIFKHIDFNKKYNITTENTTLEHHPEIAFYSLDGQLVTFTDKNVKEYERVLHKEKLITENITTSDYRVMMLLEDGFWRVRHLVKNSVRYKDSILKKNTFLKIKGADIYEGDTIFKIKGINYYPQKNPWDIFGDRFDTTIIDNDFKRIAKTGLNTIRIFIQYDDFGKAAVKDDKLKKLKTLLDKAKSNKLKVIVTLFDFYGDYSVLDWTLTHRHVEKIVTAVKDHTAILAWDLKNEPDLDFDSRGQENVVAWLKEIAWQIRSLDSNHLITIGFFNPEAATLLKDEVDFISYHFYGTPTAFKELYTTLKKTAPDKPLVLQEFGMSSYRGFWNPLGYSKKNQATYHQKMQEIFKKNDVQFVSWTLYDFKEVPKEVIGSLPWRKNKQKHFGFIDKNGREKPSFKYINSN